MALEYLPPNTDINDPYVWLMIQHLRDGGSLPPIIACGSIALSGSHRLAAWKSEEIEPPTVKISNSDYCDAMRTMGLDPFYDHITEYHEFCDILRANGVDLGEAE